MTLLFASFLLISLAHMGEEYFFPGGFMDFMKRMNPRFAPFVSREMAIVANGAQLVLCIAAIVVGEKALWFSMSAAGLLFLNGLAHIAASIRTRGYAPGVVSGALLYLPVSAYAYSVFIRSGGLSLTGVLITGLLGLLYQALPISYLFLASRKKA